MYEAVAAIAGCGVSPLVRIGQTVYIRSDE